MKHLIAGMVIAIGCSVSLADSVPIFEVIEAVATSLEFGNELSNRIYELDAHNEEPTQEALDDIAREHADDDDLEYQYNYHYNKGE